MFRLLDAPSIGLRLSGGYAVEPEQSTLAIVAHHPQAVYFGMKSGFLPKTDKQAADELIAGTDKDPTRLANSPTPSPSSSTRASQRWPRPAQPRAPTASSARRALELGRAGSLTGVACIARSRTSRQDMPSLSSAGMPIRIAVETSTACRITP